MARRPPQRKDSELLLQGVKAWNTWRDENAHLIPYLREENLSGLDLKNYDLSNANLSRSDLSGANLSGADLYQAELYRASLRGACLRGCDMRGAKLHLADLTNADLGFTDLFRADFIGACLEGTNFDSARCDTTAFAHLDLSRSLNLDRAIHSGPSNIDVLTLRLSSKDLPITFLCSAGIPQTLLEDIPSLLMKLSQTQYHSCFISYSHRDEDFARCLFRRLRQAQIQVWFAPESAKRGRKLHEQIDEAIHRHDKLLLVLSQHSMGSNWVVSEVRKALKRQQVEGRKMLFPVRLTDFEILKRWECFDTDSGRDIATEIREYFIPDFSRWQDAVSFERSAQDLIRDLIRAQHA